MNIPMHQRTADVSTSVRKPKELDINLYVQSDVRAFPFSTGTLYRKSS